MGDGVDRLFASPLAGEMRASIGLAEWADPRGGYDPPRYTASLHLHRNDDEAAHDSDYLGWP